MSGLSGAGGQAGPIASARRPASTFVGAVELSCQDGAGYASVGIQQVAVDTFMSAEWQARAGSRLHARWAPPLCKPMAAACCHGPHRPVLDTLGHHT